MPWKNGLGTTAQIDLFPAEAPFPSDSFLWRLSSAVVKTSSPFSTFPRCERLLTVLQGAGLLLNQKPLKTFEVLQFSGEENIHCELLADEVTDLGLIYRRDQVRAHMQIQELNESEEISFQSGVHYLFSVSGKIMVQDQVLEKGDCLCLEGPHEVILSAAAPTKYCTIHVELMS